MTWWNLIQLIKHRHCVESPLIYREMGYCLVFHFTSYGHVWCYQCHTVCLHLLVMYCNNSPSTCVYLQLLFIIIIFLVCCFSHLFLHLVFWENDVLAGPTLWFIDVACFNYCVSFVCFFACCSKSLEIQKKLSLDLSSNFKWARYDVSTHCVKLLWIVFWVVTHYHHCICTHSGSRILY